MGLTVRVRGRRQELALEAGRLSPRPRGSEGVTLAPHAAELVALLTRGLGSGVQLRRTPGMSATAVYVVGPDGDVLRNYGVVPERQSGPPWSPVTVALVMDDPEQPVDIYLEPVPDTPVGYEGNLALSVADAAARLTRHYAPALTPPAVHP
ncbi:hypothetical protein [Streptomyces sp. NPDC002276]